MATTATRTISNTNPSTTEAVISAVDGVLNITELKIRWHGHQLHISASIGVDPNLTVASGHDTAHQVEHALHHAFSFPVVAVIHVDPEGESSAHNSIAHHHDRKPTHSPPVET
jgi:divalent metal cation (Fe/Co/Zn/Cd) transporter